MSPHDTQGVIVILGYVVAMLGSRYDCKPEDRETLAQMDAALKRILKESENEPQG